MNQNINLYMWISASFPIFLLLVLIIKLHMTVMKSAFIGFLVTIVTAKFVYKADAFLILTEVLKGLWSALNIILIIWTAVFLSEVVKRAQVFNVFKKELDYIIPSKTLHILIAGWIFPSFLQGITGFGVPVAVCAPLLAGMGVSPLNAVIITLLGQSWGSTFGTLALAWDALALQTSLSSSIALYTKTAFYTAFFIWIWNLISGLLILLIYKKGKIELKEVLVVFLISCIHGLGQLYFVTINTTLACFIPSAAAFLCILFIGQLPCFNLRNKKVYDKNLKELNKAFFAYYILTIITLVVLLINPLKEFLNKAQISFSFPKTETGYNFVNDAVINYAPIHLLTHAGLFLFIAGLLGYIYYRRINWIKTPQISSICGDVIRKSTPSTVAVLLFIIISKLMLGSGQIYVLSYTMANIFQGSYVFLSSFTGLLGTFITSSNMASNILFGSFQEITAKTLNLSIPLMLAAQTTGGAIGTILAPGNIVLGTAATSSSGDEHKILKKVIPIALISTSLISIIVLILNNYIK